MRTIAFFSLLFMLFLWSCSGNSASNSTADEAEPQKLEEQLFDEVMAIHDDVMPEMADINRLTRQLDTLLQTNTFPEEKRPQVVATMQALDAADEDMYAWMNGFRQLEAMRNEGMSHEQIMAYLNEEKTKIEQVRDAMRSSIEQGKKLVPDYAQN